MDAGSIRSLVTARSFQLECARVLRESMLVPVLIYGTETMIWKEKERSRIRAVQMGNLRGLLGIRKMDTDPNAQIRQLCGVAKGVDEKINGVLRCGRMQNDRIAMLEVAQWVGHRRSGLMP